MQITPSKIIALIVTIGYAQLMLTLKTPIFGKAVAINIGVAVIALALIWFPEELGSVTGFRLPGRGGIPGGRVNQTTPGCAVAVLGWMMLLGFPLVMYIMTHYDTPVPQL